MSLIPQKMWNKLNQLTKCPKCGCGNFNIKTITDVTTYYVNGKKKHVESAETDSQNFQCSECDLCMDEMGFEV